MKNALNLKSVLLTAIAACLFLTPVLNAHPNTDEEMLDAAKTGKVLIIKNLLEHGADVNVEDKLGNTPLIFASKIGDTPTIDLLLKHKAEVNSQNRSGATALMLAAKYGHEHVIVKLLDHDADPLITNNNGNTAAIIAKAYGNHSLHSMLKKAERKANKIS